MTPREIGLFPKAVYGSFGWRMFQTMGLFNAFSIMIDELPVEVIPKALELERQMLEADIACHRTASLDEARSILTFCQFLGATKLSSGS
jgi:hypothetical protein